LGIFLVSIRRENRCISERRFQGPAENRIRAIGARASGLGRPLWIQSVRACDGPPRRARRRGRGHSLVAQGDLRFVGVLDPRRIFVRGSLRPDGMKVAVAGSKSKSSRSSGCTVHRSMLLDRPMRPSAGPVAASW